MLETGGNRVLLVDDESTVTRVAEKTLRREFGDQLRIHAITDGREALMHLSLHRCDLLLSDIEMPGVNGMEILRHARACNAWTRVIFMTAHSSWDHIADAIEQGATDYLLKPLVAEQLIEVVGQEVRRLIRWRSALRESLVPA